MFKNSMVHLLPTKEARDCLYKNRGTNKLNYHKGYLTQDYLNNSLNSESFHIYITSDDKIINGDWYLNSINQIFQCGTHASEDLCKDTGCRKIIATTDKSLYNNEIKLIKGSDNNKYPVPNILPQLSYSFISKFMESCNNNPIIDVLVEYEQFSCPEDLGICVDFCKNNCLKLKVNKNNTITIKKVKDSWNKEELFEELSKIAGDVRKDGFGIWSTPKSYTSNWMKENNL